MKLILCILAMLCLYGNGLTQPRSALTHGITIGETMPDIYMKNVENYPQRDVQFSSFQKDLTIIDFWATWCGSCIGAFPKMHELQRKFSNKLNILMVNASTDDSPAKLKAFFERRKIKTGKDFTLTRISQDTVFRKMFPYKSIPHYVWIDKNRKVIAITEGNEVTEENINEVLKGKIPTFTLKNDALLFNLETNNIDLANVKNVRILHKSAFTEEIFGAGINITYFPGSDSTSSKLKILNYTLIDLYKAAFSKEFSKVENRIIFDSVASLFFENNIERISRKKYCYELYTNSANRPTLIKFLANDLVEYFKFQVTRSEKWVSSYSLKAGKDIDKIYSKGGQTRSDLGKGNKNLFIKNNSLKMLANFLSKVLNNPVFDETGIIHFIDIDFPNEFYDFNINQVKGFLFKNGIELHEEKRLQPFVYISKIN